MTQAWDAAGFGAGDAKIVPYENTHRSIEKVAEIARDARHDPDLRGWAIDQLAKAGFDGRARTATPRQTAQVILDAVRANTTYVPDPAGSEWIQKPRVTLCIGNSKCIRGGDCDDMVALLASLLLSIGQPCYIVKQEFGAGAQEHVLVGIIDKGDYLYVDPANTTRPVYTGSRATEEFWVDPLEQVGNTGRSSPDFVTLGRAPDTVHRGPVRTVANPQLMPLARVGTGATFGLVSMSEIDQLDAQVQAGVTALQDAAKACPSLSQSDQDALAGFATAWGALHTQWQTVRSTMTQSSTAGSVAALLLPVAWPVEVAGAISGIIALQFTTIANDMRGYLARIGDWQGRLKQVCSNYMPPPGVPVPVPAPNAPTPASELADSIAAAAKAVGTVAAVGGAIYVGYLGLQFLRSLPKPRAT